jgi:hypothetical protein
MGAIENHPNRERRELVVVVHEAILEVFHILDHIQEAQVPVDLLHLRENGIALAVIVPGNPDIVDHQAQCILGDGISVVGVHHVVVAEAAAAVVAILVVQVTVIVDLGHDRILLVPVLQESDIVVVHRHDINEVTHRLLLLLVLKSIPANTTKCDYYLLMYISIVCIQKIISHFRTFLFCL